MNNKHNGTPPSRHLAAFFTFLSLLPLVLYIPPWIAEHVSDDQLVVTVLAVAVIVPLISYVALPGMFRIWRVVRALL